MGKIYNDIETMDNEDVKVKRVIDNFMFATYDPDMRTDVIHRDNLIRRIHGIMRKNEYSGVLLVGDKGIGKHSIIEGFVNHLYTRYDINRVYILNFDKFLERPSDEFTTLSSDVLKYALEHEEVILNVNHIGHLLDGRLYGNGGYNFVDRMAKAVSYGHLKVILTATNKEYEEVKENLPFVLDAFNIIHVKELNVDETEDIIRMEVRKYGDMCKLRLPDDTARIITETADKYIKDRPFPAKAEWLLDEVCANLRRMKTDDDEILKTLDRQEKYCTDIKKAFEKGNYNKCLNLNTKIEDIDTKVELHNEKISKAVYEITESEILKVMGDILNVKMSGFDRSQTSGLQKMSSKIKESVMGQDGTVDIIVKSIIRNKLGLRRAHHSMGNFIFIGSTGTGKTYMAKKIAEQLYGSEENMLRFDMSEYQSEIDANKLLGSPPGYVGYKESGQLVKQIKKYPERVILFDEIEKAHPKIYDVLLQLLDEGFITGSDGEKVDATKSLIIFTSNIGVKKAKEFGNTVGFSLETDLDSRRKEEIMKKALNKRFSPEFLNRLDGVCYFNPLERDVLKKILHREMDMMNENIENICGKRIHITEEVETWILDRVVEEDNGARPIIRHLQQNIEEELSMMIVEDSDVLKSDKKILETSIENDKVTLN